ncbi:Immunoglobulin super member 9, partial [Desmophyllum pertusum]
MVDNKMRGLIRVICFLSFIHPVPPRFVETPDRVISVIGNKVASVSCRAFGFPSPTIVWSRGLVSLPQGRTTVTNVTLNISNFSPHDSGTYQCKASN